MEIVYTSQNGSKYSLDSEGRVLRNGDLFPHKDPRFKYAGIIDAELVWELLNGHKEEEWASLLYQAAVEERTIIIMPVPFQDVGDYIDGRIALACFSEKLERIVCTSPLVKKEN